MKIREYVDKHAYQILLTLLPTLAGMLILNEALHIELHDLIVAFLALLFIVVLRIFDYNKKQLVFLIALGGVLVVIAGLVIYNFDALCILKDEFLLIAKGQLKSQDIGGAQLLLMDLILLASCSIPLYLLQKSKTTRVLLAIGGFIGLLIAGTKEELLDLYGIAFAFLYILLVLWETCIIQFLKHRKLESSRVMPYLAPLLALFLLLADNMPISGKPVTLHTDIVNGVKNTVTAWYNDIKYWLAPNNGEYDVNMLGYSEDSEFGSLNTGESKVNLTFISRNPLGQTVYLRGNWKNIYTGHNWKEKMEDTEIYKNYAEDKLDWAEMMYALYRYDRFTALEDLVHIDNIDIVYKDIETSSLFFPLKSTDIKASMALDFTKPENLNFETLVREGNRYLFLNLKMNYNSEKWKDFVSQSQGYVYSGQRAVDMENYRKLLQEHKIAIERDCCFSTEEILARRADYIKEQFTKVPEELPERVEELTSQITKDCTTTLEKCQAIEKYLKTYRYTIHPKQVAEDKDLVDSFLFETKEGYCSYFATAMAIMARTQGIPSRYAQGFAVSTGLRPNSEYEVSSSNAHAWVEIYIEGIGWMTFDPTPSDGSGLKTEYSWGDGNYISTPPPAVNSGDSKMSFDELQKYYEEMAKRQKEGEEENTQQSVDIVKWVLLILLLVVGISLVLAVAYTTIRIVHNRSALKRKTGNERVYVYMAQIMYLLEALHCNAKEEETLHQYIDRIQGRFIEMHPSLTELEKLYTSIRYSKREVTKQELELIEKIKEQLLKILRDKCSLYRYVLLYLRYVMTSFR